MRLLLPVAAQAEECPNAAFRTGPSAHLPDCRAYELVTPPFKNAAKIQVKSIGPEGSPSWLISVRPRRDSKPSRTSLSTRARRLTTRSPRTTSGWATVPDEPPTSEYVAARNGLSDSAGEGLGGQDTLWYERKVGQPLNSVGLFMRRPDRSVVEVGPILPPTAPAVLTPRVLLEQPTEALGIGESADGSRVFFALQYYLWPGDSTEQGHGIASVYEYLGVENKVPLLVGVGDNGELISQCGVGLGGAIAPDAGLDGPGGYQDNAVSADGNTVFFTAFPDGTKGCNASAPPVRELFARIDNGLPGAHTVAISEPTEEDCAACYEGKVLKSAGQLAGASFVGASEDGSKVFFETTQPLLGGDSSNDLYEYDFDAPPGQRIMRVSGGDGTVSNPTADVMEGDAGEHLWFQVSQDGSHAYFLAEGVLTNTPNRQGESAQAGAPNLYVFERDAEHPSGYIAFIARLSPTDLGQASEKGFQSNVTPDGRFLLFTSYRDLTPDDTSTVRQLFEYDAQTGALVRVSIGQDGYDDNGNSPANFVTIQSPFYGFFDQTRYWSYLSVSADGSYVFFESSAALTPNALEGFKNVYEYHDGQVSLISDGQDITRFFFTGESIVKFLGTDASGKDVFFMTADRLVGQDTDTSVDIYDARIDGGFPGPAAPAACVGEGCQGALRGAPTLLSPGSEFQAGANPPLAAGAPVAASKPKAKTKRCKSGTRLERGRCVKRRAKSRRAGVDHRGGK